MTLRVPVLFLSVAIFLGWGNPCRAEALRLLARTTFPYQMAVGKTKLGGLSGVSYDAATKSWWAISDDSANHGGPPRAYQLSIQFTAPSELVVRVQQTLILRDAKGQPFPVADCEGIACTGRGGIWVSSEGREGKAGAPPWVKLFSLSNGRTVRTLPLPVVYLPAATDGTAVLLGDPRQTRGLLPNKSLESCSLSPDLSTVFIANETSLAQEKAPGEGAGGAGFFNGTQVRISALQAKTGACFGQKLYVADAGCFFGSVSDVTPLDQQGNLLVLERRIVKLQEGTGCVGIRIYRVDFQEAAATDLREIASVAGKTVAPLTKILLYDSRKENVDDLDNVEGLGWMRLPGGRTGLVMVSDDNFSKVQQTQILLYELTR